MRPFSRSSLGPLFHPLWIMLQWKWRGCWEGSKASRRFLPSYFRLEPYAAFRAVPDEIIQPEMGNSHENKTSGKTSYSSQGVCRLTWWLYLKMNIALSGEEHSFPWKGRFFPRTLQKKDKLRRGFKAVWHHNCFSSSNSSLCLDSSVWGIVIVSIMNSVPSASDLSNYFICWGEASTVKLAERLHCDAVGSNCRLELHVRGKKKRGGVGLS